MPRLPAPGVATVLLVFVALVALVAAPAAGQAAGRAPIPEESSSVRFALTADAAASFQDNLGRLSFGRDMVTYGVRATAIRRVGLHPWVDVAHFTRPELECVATLPCTRSGLLTRGGVTLPLSGRQDASGLTAGVRGGVGAAFADESSLSYLIGFALQWRRIPRVSPLVEFRWEHIAGINLMMLAAGVRIDL